MLFKDNNKKLVGIKTIKIIIFLKASRPYVLNIFFCLNCRHESFKYYILNYNGHIRLQTRMLLLTSNYHNLKLSIKFIRKQEKDSEKYRKGDRLGTIRL